jgi:putative membrane protein
MKVRIMVVGALGALLSATLVQADDATGKHFIKESIEGNLAEVKVGQLAQHKGASQGVKDFGAALVKDHGMANEKAQKVAQTMGVAPPDAPGFKQKAMYQELSALSGQRFDEHFIKGMVKDHQEDIAKYEKEVKSDSGPAADYARQVLPDLRKHLQMAEQLQQQVRSASASDSSQMK